LTPSSIRLVIAPWLCPASFSLPGDLRLSARFELEALLDRAAQISQLRHHLRFDVAEAGDLLSGDASLRKCIRQADEFGRLFLELRLLLPCLIWRPACHERWRRRGNLGTLLGKAQRAHHSGYAVCGDARHRSLYLGKGVPSHRTGDCRERRHPAEGDEQLGLDAEAA
jgi:hypothetical protein